MNTPNFHELKYNNFRIVLAYGVCLHGDMFFVCELENKDWVVCNEMGTFGSSYSKEQIENTYGWKEYMVKDNIVYSHNIKPKQIKICTCDIVAMWNYGHTIGCVERK